MLFAVDLERRRALQIGPFRGYDADAADARTRATRNKAKLKQDPEGARGGLRIERMRAGPGEGGAEVGAGQLTPGAEGLEDAGDRLPRRCLAGEDAEREGVLGGGKEGMDEAACRRLGERSGGSFEVGGGPRGVDEDYVFKMRC